MSRLAISLYAVFLAMLWVGQLAATIGWFNGWWLLPCCASFGLLVYFLAGNDTSPCDRWTWGAWTIALIAMFFSWPPGHAMQMQWDPAVYVQSGAVIAREGGIAFSLPVYHDLPRIIQDLVSYPSHPASPYSGMVFTEQGKVIPVFYHLFPVWIAWCHTFGGLNAALAANIPLLGISALLMFALVRRWYGPGWGVLAALMLSFFPVQWWQARFTTAELLAQVLLLGGFLLLDQALERKERNVMPALLSGISFGLAMLAKFDALLVIVPLVILVVGVWNVPRCRSLVGWVIFPVVVLSVHAYVHALWMGSPYFPRKTWVVAGLALALSALIFQAVVLVWTRRSPIASWNAIHPTFSRLMAIGWLSFIGVAWMIRPGMANMSDRWEWLPEFPAAWSQSALLRVWNGHDAWNLAALESVAGWPLLLAGIVGMALLLLPREDRAARRVWVWCAIPVWVILVFSLHHEREMMWMCRRFVPVMVPSLIIGGISLFHFMATHARLRISARRFYLAVVMLAVLLGLKNPIVRVWPIREFYGTKSGFVSLAKDLNAEAIVFADVPGVGAILRTAYGFDAFDLNGVTMERREILMRWLPAMQSVRPIVFITPVPMSDAWAAHYRLTGSHTFSARIYEQPERNIPVQFVDLSSPFLVYEVVPYEAGDSSP